MRQLVLEIWRLNVTNMNVFRLKVDQCDVVVALLKSIGKKV